MILPKASSASFCSVGGSCSVAKVSGLSEKEKGEGVARSDEHTKDDLLKVH